MTNGHLVMLYVLNFHQVGHLPLSHPKDGGQLYLANMGIPKNVYKEVIFWTLRICLRIYSLKNYVRSVSSLPLPLAPSLWSLCTSQDQLCSMQKTPLLPWQETTLVLPHGTNRCHCYCLYVSLLLKSQLVEDLIEKDVGCLQYFTLLYSSSNVSKDDSIAAQYLAPNNHVVDPSWCRQCSQLQWICIGNDSTHCGSCHQMPN